MNRYKIRTIWKLFLKVQHEPQCPWFLTGLTPPRWRQSTHSGRSRRSTWSIFFVLVAEQSCPTIKRALRNSSKFISASLFKNSHNNKIKRQLLTSLISMVHVFEDSALCSSIIIKFSWKIWARFFLSSKEYIFWYLVSKVSSRWKRVIYDSRYKYYKFIFHPFLEFSKNFLRHTE